MRSVHLSDADLSAHDAASGADAAGVEILIPIVVLLTATLSGIFGMAGGMLLLAVLALVLPVEAAMVFHGAVQFVSNGSRFLMHRKHLYCKSLLPYLMGCVAAVLVCLAFGVRLDRASLFLCLGVITLIGLALPTALAPRFSDARAAGVCGAAVTSAQLTAGVSGPVLDYFFLRGDVEKRGVLATKALTQCVGHALKILWFGLALPAADTLPPIGVWVACLALAPVGSALGRRVVLRLSELSFRRYSRGIVFVLAILCLVQGMRL